MARNVQAAYNEAVRALSPHATSAARQLRRHPGRILAGTGATLLTLAAADAYWDRSRADRADDGHATYLSRMPETPRPDWKSRVAAADGGRLPFATLPGVSWGGNGLFFLRPISSFVRSALPSCLLQSIGLEEPYWNERASYRVAPEGMWRLERASFELHSLILEAIDEVVRSDELLQDFGMPPELWPAIRDSWERRESDLMGRFDFLWDGEGDPKMAEYNADTPTVLIESAAAQRNWFEEKRPDKGQFNVLEEALEDAWRKVAAEQRREDGAEEDGPVQITVVAQGVSFWDDPSALGAGADASFYKRLFARIVDSFLAGSAFLEEAATAKFVCDLAKRTTPKGEGAELVEFDKLTAKDLDSSKRGPLWKLYPWEWLIYEDVGEKMRERSNGSCERDFLAVGEAKSARRRVLEPPWKLVASSKAMLAYLWQKHPNHPNLLPAALADELVAMELTAENNFDSIAKHYIAKPALGREGQGLKYGDEFDISGDKDLRDFAREAREAGEVLLLPEDAPSVPIPILSTSRPSPPTKKDVLKEFAMEANHRAMDTPFGARLLDRGAFSSAPEAAKEGLKMLVGPAIVQKYHETATLHGRTVVASAWVVRGIPVAACFREDNARTTNNNSCFVPHWVEPERETADSLREIPLKESLRPESAPQRLLPLTSNQAQLRTELYGKEPALSTAYNRAPPDNRKISNTLSGDDEETLEHREEDAEDGSESVRKAEPPLSGASARYYGSGGRGGFGCSSTGGGLGSPKKPSNGLSRIFNNIFGNRSKANAEASRQRKGRRRRKAFSSSTKQKVKSANKRMRAARTGAHGRGAVRGGRGYSG